MWLIHCRISPREISSRMVIQILVKISHITMDFVVSQASDRIILGIIPQLCITRI